jgi:excisionase family DNA binding protein
MAVINDADGTQVCTVLEACERLRCSRRYLYELLARGELESFTMGRARRIVAASIDAYVQRRLAASRRPGGEAA